MFFSGTLRPEWPSSLPNWEEAAFLLPKYSGISDSTPPACQLFSNKWLTKLKIQMSKFHANSNLLVQREFRKEFGFFEVFVTI